MRMLSYIAFAAISFFLLQNTMLNSSITSQSYRVPEPYSFIVAVIIIVLAVWLGFVFIRDIIKVIFVLILLLLLASVGYSFLTTGALSLSGISGFVNSIALFFKYITGLSHVANASNTISIVANTVNAT
ncbi:MAG: hypothetical protein ACP5RF_03740 [Candidatus Micrarchaeia archaeon]